MHKRQIARLEALLATKAFLDDPTNQFPTVAGSGVRRKFDEIMTDIRSLIADQSGSFFSAQIETRRIRKLRRVLVDDHMKPIARIAAAELPTTPELFGLRMPVGAPSLERLVAHARGMAKLAKAHADVFIDAGLPTDFLAGLATASKALIEAASERGRARGRRGGATKGLETQLARARKLVAILDAFVCTAVRDDPVRLADWRSARRVHRGTRPTSAEGAIETRQQAL